MKAMWALIAIVAIAVIGIPLAVVLLALYCVALALSCVFVSYLIGGWLLDRSVASVGDRVWRADHGA